MDPSSFTDLSTSLGMSADSVAAAHAHIADLVSAHPQGHAFLADATSWFVADGAVADSNDAMSAAVSAAASDVVYKADGVTVDKGWFGTGLLKGVDPWGTWRGFIQGSIVSLHDFLYNTCGVKENTYGYAIMLFTFSLRTLTLPLTWIQYSGTEKMKALQPIVNEIKEKYPDPQMQNMVVAKLYDDTDSNPLVGCVVPFLQIPVFIALYRSILNLANADALQEPFFFLPSLEGPTITEQLSLPNGRGLGWLTTGWTGSYEGGDLLPLLGWEDTLAYIAIPIIITLGQSLTMKVTTPPAGPDADPSMKRTQAILKYIPLMLGYFSLQVPAALCLYWFTSNTYTAFTTIAIKNYWAANPPSIDWDFLKETGDKPQVGGSLFTLEMPANMEEALDDARLNALPPRASRRAAGIGMEMKPTAAAAAASSSVEAVLAADSA